MKSEQILNICLKVMGVYFIASSVVYFPQIALSIDLANEGSYNHPWLIFTATFSSILLSLLIGYVLAAKTYIVIGFLLKNKSKEYIDMPGIFLVQWIQLLGLLLFCISIGDLIEGAISAFVMQGTIAINASMIIPSLVSVTFGVIFVIKASQIAALLNRYGNNA